MEAFNKMKKLHEEREKSKKENLKIAEIAIKKARSQLKEIRETKDKAIQEENQTLYKTAKNQEIECLQDIDYYNSLIAKNERNDLEIYDKLIEELKHETDVEYKEAAKECVEIIEKLEKASEKAANIVKEYQAGIGYYKNYIANIPYGECKMPAIYDNTLAVGLANKLQYQKNELKALISK